MREYRSLLEAILVVGAGAFVSGIVLLGTDPHVVDHRVGVWLSTIGGLSTFACLILLVLFRDDRSAKVTPPEIKVTRLARYRDFANYLEVENTGGAAEFVAQIQARGNNRLGPYPSDYVGYWEEARGGRTTILQGQRDRLLLRADAWPIDEHGEQKQVIKLFYADPDSREPKVQDSTQWGAPISIVWLRVTISSIPPFASGPFDETYQFPPEPS